MTYQGFVILWSIGLSPLASVSGRRGEFVAVEAVTISVDHNLSAQEEVEPVGLPSITATNADCGQRDIDARLAELGISLPDVNPPAGVYRRVVIVGNLAYLAGHIPIDGEGNIMRGKVGDDVSLEQAQQAARRSGIAMLASLQAELGDLNRIKRIVKTTGMVNCTPDFASQPEVINGCSQLFVDVFGAENGIGVRSAVGMNALPRGAIVEIEAIFELKDEDH